MSNRGRFSARNSMNRLALQKAMKHGWFKQDVPSRRVAETVKNAGKELCREPHPKNGAQCSVPIDEHGDWHYAWRTISGQDNQVMWPLRQTLPAFTHPETQEGNVVLCDQPHPKNGTKCVVPVDEHGPQHYGWHISNNRRNYIMWPVRGN